MPTFSKFLRYFMAVGQYGSIRRAAEELHVSASAIDRQILRAEEELGIPLFERLPSGLRLTAAGEVMMAAGGRWEKNLVDVRRQLEDLRGLRRGEVHIAVIDALAKGSVPRIVQDIQRGYPGITVTLHVLENIHVREAVARGDADFGIYLEPQRYRDLVVRAYAEVVLGFIVRPDHPFAGMTECRFVRGTAERLVVPAPPLALREHLDILESTSGAPLDIAARSDNIQMIKSLVEQGVGVGILTSIDVLTEVADGGLSFIPISDPVLRPMTLALCTASSRTHSAAASLVLTEIENRFDEFGYKPPAE